MLNWATGSFQNVDDSIAIEFMTSNKAPPMPHAVNMKLTPAADISWDTISMVASNRFLFPSPSQSLQSHPNQSENS